MHYAIAIGQNSGQGSNAIAICTSCSQTSQGSNSIALGNSCDILNQQTRFFAGYDTQGTGAIAIGAQSGATNQAANSIIINVLLIIQHQILVL